MYNYRPAKIFINLRVANSLKTYKTSIEIRIIPWYYPMTRAFKSWLYILV